MSGQNPIIPTPTQAKGIDAVIFDMQTALDLSLSWLTNGMGQAYRLAKVRTPQNIIFLPEVYLGTDKSKYFSATPDNDKIGQNVFLLGTETLPNQQQGFFGYLEYDCAILFTANLKLIDSVLLETEDFTEHLIMQVRQVIIRNLLGKSYKVEIESIERGFEETYSDFDLSNDRGISYLPLTHFRVNLTIQVREDCAGTSLNRCAAITQNLTQSDLLTCILPLYDFADVATQNALSVQQILDLKTWLLPQYDFSDIVWQNLLTAQQESDLTNYLLPLVDFTDVAIQAIITPQQQADLIAWLLPLVDFSDPAIQAIVTAGQQTDLSNWLCTPAPPTFDFSFRFLGVNEYIKGQTGGVYNLEYNNAFSCFTFCTVPAYATFTPLWTKINNSVIGIFFALNSLGKPRLLMINSIIAAGRAIEVIGVNAIPLNSLTSIGFTYDGSGNASGVAIYVNGVAQAVTIGAATLSMTILNAANCEVGATSQNFIYANYTVNSCRVWNVALSPSDAVIEGTGTAGKPNATPVSLANVIMDLDFDLSVFGFDVFAINDKSGLTSSFRTINAQFSSRIVQP